MIPWILVVSRYHPWQVIICPYNPFKSNYRSLWGAFPPGINEAEASLGGGPPGFISRACGTKLWEKTNFPNASMRRARKIANAGRPWAGTLFLFIKHEISAKILPWDEACWVTSVLTDKPRTKVSILRFSTLRRKTLYYLKVRARLGFRPSGRKPIGGTFFHLFRIPEISQSQPRV